MQYDSNVLLVNSSTPDSGDPSKVGDYRYVTGLGAEYRPYYSETQEFSLKARDDLIYSSKGDNVTADPLLYSLKAPYVYKGVLFGKGYKLEAAPGYELLYLDTDKSGATGGYLSSYTDKEEYLESLTLDLNNNFVMNDNYILAVNFKYRSDKNQTPTATGTSDPTASKWTLEWQNINFLNSTKDIGLVSTLGYTLNKSSGLTLTYNRYDLSAMVFFPVPYRITGAGGIAYYHADYPDDVPLVRTDNDLALNLTLMRPLNSWLSASLSGNYTDNQSTFDAYAYKKYLIMAVLTANWSL
jgi:hypothetical protein